MRLICSALGLLVTTGLVVGRLSYSDKTTTGLSPTGGLNEQVSTSCILDSIGCDVELAATSPSRVKSEGVWPIHMHARFNRRQAPEPTETASSESNSQELHEQDPDSESNDKDDPVSDPKDDDDRHLSTDDIEHSSSDAQTETTDTQKQSHGSDSGGRSQHGDDESNSADSTSTDSQSETKEPSATDKSSGDSGSGAQQASGPQHMRLKVTQASDSSSDQDAPTESTDSPTSHEADESQTTAVAINQGGSSNSANRPKHRTLSGESSKQRPTKALDPESSMPQTSSGGETTQHKSKAEAAEPSKTQKSHHFTDAESDSSSKPRQTHHNKQPSTRSKTKFDSPTPVSSQEPEPTSRSSDNSDSELIPGSSNAKRESDSDKTSYPDLATSQGRKKHGHLSTAQASGSSRSSDQSKKPSPIKHKSKNPVHPTQVHTHSIKAHESSSPSLASSSSPSQGYPLMSARPSSYYVQTVMSSSKGTHSRTRYHPTNSPYNHQSHSRADHRITSDHDTESSRASETPRPSYKTPERGSRTPTSSSSASQTTKTSATSVADHSVHSSLQGGIMSDSTSHSAYSYHSRASSHVQPQSHRGVNESSTISASTRASSNTRPTPTYLTTSVLSLKRITTYWPSESMHDYSSGSSLTHHRSSSSLSLENLSSKQIWRTAISGMTLTTKFPVSKASAEPSTTDSHSREEAYTRPYNSWRSYESARRTSLVATPTSVRGHSNPKKPTGVPRVSTESWPSAVMESTQLSLPSTSLQSDQRQSSGVLETKSLVLPSNPNQSSKATHLRQNPSTATKSTTSPTMVGSDSSSPHGAEESGSQSTGSYPEVIVPLGAQPPPKDSALVGIQFKPSLPWMWIVSQRETTAQIFTYMPKLLANGIQIDPGSIKTKELRAHPVNQTLRTIYLAFIPKSKLDDARAAFDNPLTKMSLDDLNAVEKQLLEQIEQALDFSSFASLSSNEPERIPLNTRTALVSSFSGVAGLALLGFSVWFMQRCNRQRAERKKKKQRRNTIQSFSALSNSPVSLPSELAPAPARASSFYVGDPHGSSVTAFESDGVTGTYDVASAPFMSTHREASSTPQHDSFSQQAPPHSFGESEGSARWIPDPYSLSDLIPNVRPSSSMRRTSVHQRSATYDRED